MDWLGAIPRYSDCSAKFRYCIFGKFVISSEPKITRTFRLGSISDMSIAQINWTAVRGCRLVFADRRPVSESQLRAGIGPKNTVAILRSYFQYLESNHCQLVLVTAICIRNKTY